MNPQMLADSLSIHLKAVTTLKDNEEQGLVVLVDESESRQISLLCDRAMCEQLAQRVACLQGNRLRVPETMGRVLKSLGITDTFLKIVVLVKGQYRAVLCCDDGLVNEEMRADEALVFSLATNTPMYITKRLWLEQSVPIMGADGAVSLPLNTLNMDMLQKAMDDAIEKEDYEMASRVKDELNRRGNS